MLLDMNKPRHSVRHAAGASVPFPLQPGAVRSLAADRVIQYLCAQLGRPAALQAVSTAFEPTTLHQRTGHSRWLVKAARILMRPAKSTKRGRQGGLAAVGQERLRQQLPTRDAQGQALHPSGS